MIVNCSFFRKQLALGIFLCSFFMFSKISWATFYGEIETGFHSIDSDRYGAFYYATPQFKPEKDWPLIIILYSDETEKGKDFVERWLSEIKQREVIALFVSYLEPRDLPYDSDERLLKLITQIKSVFPIDERRVLLSGFGRAAHYAFYLGHHYPKLFSSVAMMGGGAVGNYEPFWKSDSQEAKNVSFLVLYGDQDETIQKKPFAIAHEALSRRGYRIEVEEYEGLNHRFSPVFAKHSLDWFESLGGASQSTVQADQTDGKNKVSSVFFGAPKFAFSVIRGIFKG